MPDTTNDHNIDGLLGFLSLASNNELNSISALLASNYYDALTALVAERNALIRHLADATIARTALAMRVKTLEPQEFPLPDEPFRDPDRDLRERLVCAALTGIASAPDAYSDCAVTVADWAVVRADAMIAAMRKGEADGK